MEHRWKTIHLTSDLYSCIKLVMDCSPPALTFRFERIFNRMRCVLACFGGNVIVQNSEFCDGEKARQYIDSI